MEAARRFAILAIAGSLPLMTIACGDDQPRLVACLPTGGGGGASAMGHGGSDGGAGGGGSGQTGRGGSIGSAGVGAAGRGGGAAGSSGVGGRGGSGGAPGTTGVAGRGGTGGAAGGSTGAAGKGGRGGAGGAAGSGGTGGTGVVATPGYSGCSHVGGVDRIRVTKIQSASGLCFDLNLWLTGHEESPDLPLPQNWMLMNAIARPCASSDASATASAVSGTVDWPPQVAFNLPPTVNVDVTLTFSGSGNDGGVPASERLNGQNVDIRTNCP